MAKSRERERNKIIQHNPDDMAFRVDSDVAEAEGAVIATLRRRALLCLIVMGDSDEQELIEVARMYTQAWHGDFSFMGKRRTVRDSL